jgi:hypothetical protein
MRCKTCNMAIHLIFFSSSSIRFETGHQARWPCVVRTRPSGPAVQSWLLCVYRHIYISVHTRPGNWGERFHFQSFFFFLIFLDFIFALSLSYTRAPASFFRYYIMRFFWIIQAGGPLNICNRWTDLMCSKSNYYFISPKEKVKWTWANGVERGMEEVKVLF